MFYVYAIQNVQKGDIYIGQTSDLKERIDRHNQVLKSKKSSFTAKHPGHWQYIYIETCTSRSEAMKRERQLKTAKGREYVRLQSQVKVSNSAGEVR